MLGVVVVVAVDDDVPVDGDVVVDFSLVVVVALLSDEPEDGGVTLLSDEDGAGAISELFFASLLDLGAVSCAITAPLSVSATTLIPASKCVFIPVSLPVDPCKQALIIQSSSLLNVSAASNVPASSLPGACAQ